MLLKKTGNLLSVEKEGMRILIYDSKYSFVFLDIGECHCDVSDEGFLILYCNNNKPSIIKFLNQHTEAKHSSHNNVITINIGEPPASVKEPKRIHIFDTSILLTDRRVHSIVYECSIWSKVDATKHLKANHPGLNIKGDIVKNANVVFIQNLSKLFVKDGWTDQDLGDGIHIILGEPKPEKVKRSK